MSLFQQAIGDLIVMAHARGQREAAYRPRSRWMADRNARIAASVRYAARSVPYYQRLFAERAIDPRAIRSPEDLRRLPLLDKATVRRDPDAFVSRSWRGRRSVPFVTTGSTGAPLRVHHDMLSLLANIAYGERSRKTEGLGGGGRPRMMSFSRDMSTGTKVHDIYRRWTFIPRRPERIHMGVDRPFREAISAINEHRPHLLGGYGSYLEALFRFVLAERVEIHRPERIGYFSDGMTAPGRRLIEEEFGIPVLASYSAMESFKIGFSCERGTGYHIHEDLCHLRVIDGDGADAAPGECGEIVISNLVNRGSVLLNYRLGDLGALGSEPCPCGRTLPLLAELEGRKEDLLYIGPDWVVHPRAVWGVFSGIPSIVQYQLVQHEARRFELEIVARDRDDREGTRSAATDGLRKLLGDVDVVVRFSDGPLSGPGGKARPVISHCPPPALA